VNKKLPTSRAIELDDLLFNAGPHQHNNTIKDRKRNYDRQTDCKNSMAKHEQQA
jgi:hypothetical protein